MEREGEGMVGRGERVWSDEGGSGEGNGERGSNGTDSPGLNVTHICSWVLAIIHEQLSLFVGVCFHSWVIIL